VNKLIFLIGVCSRLTYAYSETNHDSSKIEEEIKNRKEQLDQLRLKGENQVVESQGDMIADWPQYSQKVEEIKKTQAQVNKLEKEIQELDWQKTHLLTKPSPSSNVQE